MPPNVQGRWLKKARPYDLKEILHAYARASVPRRQLNAHLVKARRSEPDYGVSREAESLARNSHEPVQFPIGVFVVEDGHRILAGRNGLKLDVTSVGRNRARERLRISLAVGKVRGKTRQTDLNRPALIPQAGDIDVDDCGRADRGDQRESEQDDGKPAHWGLAYQQRHALAKCLNS